jgi:hypothetical protein
MIRAGVLTITQQILLSVFVPPVLTFIWWLLNKVKRDDSERNGSHAGLSRMEDSWKYVLIFLYIITIWFTLHF